MELKAKEGHLYDLGNISDTSSNAVYICDSDNRINESSVYYPGKDKEEVEYGICLCVGRVF